jgi:hypothetical protein
MPVKITAPPAKVYEYYDPDNKNTTQPIPMIIRARV